MSSSLAKKTINGVKWTTVSTVANSLLQIGYTSIMARLLSPSAFGLIALTNIILRFGGYFATMGLGSSIVQKEHLSNEDIRAGFTSSLILGSFTTIILWILAPFSVYIFDDPLLVPVLRVMVFSFFITSITSTSASILRRNIQFKEMSIVETVSYIVAYLGVGVTLAYFDYGVWSLVYASLAQSFVFLVLCYFIVRHSLVFLFKWENYKSLFSYGSRISVISFTEFIGAELDTMIIGKVLGPRDLGFYNRGFMLVRLPLYFMTTSLSKVLFPSFSRIQADLDKLKKVYLSSIVIVTAVLIPVGAGIAVSADEIVFLLLGEQWEPSIPILQILAIGFSIGFANIFAGIVCDATANLSRKIKVTTLHIVILIILFALLSPFGLIGFSIAVTLGHFAKTAMYVYVMSKVVKVTIKELLACYLPGLLNGLLIGGILFAVKQLLVEADYPPLIILICLSVAGALVFISAVFIFPMKILREEFQKFLTRFDFTSSKKSFYNKTMLSYMNYLSRKQ